MFLDRQNTPPILSSIVSNALSIFFAQLITKGYNNLLHNIGAAFPLMHMSTSFLRPSRFQRNAATGKSGTLGGLTVVGVCSPLVRSLTRSEM